jgi:hypothetical protein
MLKQPKERTVEFVRPTFISRELLAVGTKRTFPTAFAAELVSGGKAKFAEPDPEPIAPKAKAKAEVKGDESKTTEGK